MHFEDEQRESPVQNGWENAKTNLNQALGGALGASPRNEYSIRMEKEKSAYMHEEQAMKDRQAVAFFTAHPEFDEFVQLLRSNVIRIW